VHVLVLAIFGFIILALFAATVHYQGENFWKDWLENGTLKHPTYTEHIYPSDFFRTRSNTWSNCAYILVGLYAFAFAYTDSKKSINFGENELIQSPQLSILFGLSCCFLGFCSGLFHASLSRLGQHLDVASMYPPLLSCIAIFMNRWIKYIFIKNNTGDSKLWIIFYVLITVMSYYLYKFKWSMSAFKVLTCLISILGIFGLIDYLFFRHMFCFKWLMLSVLALVSARIIWLRDVAKKFSAPDFLFQGHALWHVLTALSLMSLYFYLRSESAMPITKQKT